MKLSQSNFNLRSPDCYLVRSYLIATVPEQHITTCLNLGAKKIPYQCENFIKCQETTYLKFCGFVKTDTVHTFTKDPNERNPAAPENTNSRGLNLLQPK